MIIGEADYIFDKKIVKKHINTILPHYNNIINHPRKIFNMQIAFYFNTFYKHICEYCVLQKINKIHFNFVRGCNIII